MVYGLFSLLTISGIKIATHGNNNKKQNQEIVAEDVVTRPTIYNPSDTSFSKDFVKDYWTEIVIGLLEFETWRDKPKLQSGESRYTYGPGLTWVYVNNKQYPCVGKYKDMATNFSEAEIWDQVKHHALYGGEVMDKIKRALIQYDITEISQNQLLGLFFAGYQMPSQINAIVKRLSLAENEEKSSIDAFIAGKEVRQKFRNGTNKRRWWCAMLYTGKISVKDFLIMDRDSFSKLELKNILKDGHFIYTANVIKDAKNKSNPKTESVETFISESHLPLRLEEMIKMYREHRPHISLEEETRGILDILQKESVLGIITDGRSLTQRNKIEALGLYAYIPEKNICISEETGYPKPSSEPFVSFMQAYPDSDYYYIGDNPSKDFVAPNQLGWNTICLLDDGRNIHHQDSVVAKAYQARYEVKSLSEVLCLIRY